MNDSVIDLRGLTKVYSAQLAVDHLNLRVSQGEIFGLLGPNGAGKTTTILMMLGLTEPTSGSVRVCGIDATKNPVEVKRKVGYLPDNVGFYDYMSGLESLIFVGMLNGLDEEDARVSANQLLVDVGLEQDKDKKTGAYSRGMKQRLGLAEVLIKSPEVIILDEPTLGIDPSGVRDFLNLIKDLSKQHGITVLLSSHHLHHVQQVCDRVGIFVQGKLIADGTIDSLSKKLFDQDGYKTQIRTAERVIHPEELIGQLKQVVNVTEVIIKDKQIEVSATANVTPELVQLLVGGGVGIEEVHKRTYGLDEIYQKYFDGGDVRSSADYPKEKRIFGGTFLNIKKYAKISK
ncbi:ABC transporter ATP-binding protein [Olivibacter sp. SDN3]|uniref:ABC transporter ATP-binding protein n=1 Tax=Olivibacter sp. SDN3 TaxID=2764720 RepID=UPI0016517CD9|nr:ABC transporter ATP-binding protein [Olivibacter sp. SDN3]QNL48099.1 ABC transporter ATP-binding protein [Olivibacter sp. SDN3]